MGDFTSQIFLSGEYLAAKILATSVSRQYWSEMLILSSGNLSSSEVSKYLLLCSELVLAVSWSPIRGSSLNVTTSLSY